MRSTIAGIGILDYVRALLSDTLYGRDECLRAIETEIARAKTGQGGVGIVRGHAGVGKSALLNAVRSEHPGHTLWSRCPEGYHAPLFPLTQLAAAAYSAGADVSSPALAAYRRTLARLHPGLDGGTRHQDAESAEWGAVVLGEALLQLIRHIPLTTYRVITIEDVHWADGETWLAIEHLSDRLSRSPVMLLVSLRTEENTKADLRAQRMIEGRRATGFDLDPLGPDDHAEMLAACLGQPSPAALMSAAWEFAEGNPFLIEEFLAGSVATGRLRHVEHEWQWLSGSALPPPGRFIDTVRDRWSRLSVETQGILAVAAMLGRGIDIDLLTDITRASDLGVVAALESAVSAHLIETGPGSSEIRFRHALTTQAIVRCLTGVQRRTVATDAFRNIRAQHPKRLLAAVALAIAAGRPTDASDFLILAARDSIENGLATGALEQLSAAAELAAGDTDRIQRIQVARVRAAALAGEVEVAYAASEELLADPLLRASDRRAVTLALARAQVTAGSAVRAVELLRPLTADAEDSALNTVRALAELGRGAHDLAEHHASLALRSADVGAHPDLACEALLVRGRVARERDLDEAQGYFRDAIGLAEANGLALWHASALHEAATIPQLQRLEVADLRLALDAAVSAGAPGLASTIEFHLAAVLGVRFDVEEALSYARNSLASWHRLGAPTQEAYSWILIAQAHAAAGRKQQAEAAAGEAVRLAGEIPEIASLAMACGRGLVSVLHDDWPKARLEYAAAIAALDGAAPTPLPPWYLWPLLAAVQPPQHGAPDAADALAAADNRGLRVSPGPDALWRLADAVSLGRAGDIGNATFVGQDAIDRLRDVGDGFAGYRSIGLWLTASAAVTDGWGTPAQWLTEAESWFNDHALPKAAAGCRRQATRAGVPLRRRRGDISAIPVELRIAGVTAREHDVLTLVAEGLSNAEIAERLYISVRTVKTHVEHLLAKTGATNRVQLSQFVR